MVLMSLVTAAARITLGSNPRSSWLLKQFFFILFAAVLLCRRQSA